MAGKENSGLRRKGSDVAFIEQPHSSVPAPPLPAPLPEMLSDEEQTCLDALEEMVIIHKKYEDIINKIKSGEGQLFLVKCNTSGGLYHFLARYTSDTFGEYMQENKAFPNVPNPCDKKTAKQYDTLKKFEEKYNKGPPSMFFNFVHQKKDSDEKQLKLGRKYFPYEKFKKSIIPINEAFMYKDMIIENIGTGHIVDYTSEAETEREEEVEVVEEEEGVEYDPPSRQPSEEIPESDHLEVEDGMKVVDIELEEELVGGKKKKKKRKKRSRSKKRIRQRKNNTKKN
jgi:hypothetical protein